MSEKLRFVLLLGLLIASIGLLIIVNANSNNVIVH